MEVTGFAAMDTHRVFIERMGRVPVARHRGRSSDSGGGEDEQVNA